MGLVVRVFTRRNLIAIAIGVLLAAAPLVAFDFWLDGLIDRQGQALALGDRLGRGLPRLLSVAKPIAM